MATLARKTHSTRAHKRNHQPYCSSFNHTPRTPKQTQMKPILFQSSDACTFILDIPASIACAQHFTRDTPQPQPQPQPRLLSCAPLAEPYTSTEPKSELKRGESGNHARDAEVHEEIARCARRAIEVVKAALGNDAVFCGERVVLGESAEVRDCGGGRSRRKRKFETAGDGGESDDGEMGMHDRNRGLAGSGDGLAEVLEALKNLDAGTCTVALHPLASLTQDVSHLPREPDSTTLPEAVESKYLDQQISNDTAQTCILDVNLKTHNQVPFKFLIPPYADLMFSRIRGRFDFLLLDPPWPNRSAIRKSAYSTTPDLGSLKRLLLPLDLDMHIEASGCVGIWITNKPAARQLVLGAGGLFESWNVALVEEWIWVKITQQGQPVTELDGLWRKPYEVLLVGKAPEDRMIVAKSNESVKRRVLLAVPDLHSRKPCLKALVEGLLLGKREGYRALELFARNLVAGWSSWGYEALKYNWVGFWSMSEVEQQDCG